MTGTRRTALGLLAFAVFMACWPQLPVPVFWICLLYTSDAADE